MGDDDAAPELTELEREFRKKKMANPAIYGNPIWEVEWDLSGMKEELTEEELFKLKEVYSMADIEHIGYLGRRQFTDLLTIMNMDVDDATLETMFTEMDENGDGQIQFDEYAVSMVNNLGKELLEEIEDIRMGDQGTRMWERGEIAWAANSGLIVISCGAALAGIIYFQFILQPLITSYFLVFLVAPVMDIFEHRPMACGSKEFCDLTEPDPDSELVKGEPSERRYKSEFRRSVMGKPQGGLYDCFTTCKFPHGLTILLTMVVVFGTLVGLAALVWSEISVLLEDDAFVNELEQLVEDIYISLNESGINIIRDKTEGYTADELSAILATMQGFIEQCGLIFLLWTYLLAEKTEKRMFGDSNQILIEIENMVANYISLKFVLSFVTGMIVAIILVVLGVKLAVLWGLLSFVLNFIPNVGSMIAMFLPMPVVIVDTGLEDWQKIMAFVGPACVQGYVGNALEPMVFGKSLNMTPLAILMALVMWTSLWGIMGAILSVPLLGIQKICMQHTNHPMAQYFITLIREDPTVDENAEASS
jgi:predicted PurR-regulated permease PerM